MNFEANIETADSVKEKVKAAFGFDLRSALDLVKRSDYDTDEQYLDACARAELERSSPEYRAARAAKLENISIKEAQAKLNRMDKARASYHNYHAETKWGASDSYELCINSEKLTTEQAADLIKFYIDNRKAPEE